MNECCQLPCKQDVHARLLLLLLLLLLQGEQLPQPSVLQFPLLSVLCNLAEKAWWPDKSYRSAVSSECPSAVTTVCKVRGVTVLLGESGRTHHPSCADMPAE